MRTNIDIEDSLMDSALRAGPFQTKREAVEAGLKLLAKQAGYRDILALRGQLQWEAPPSMVMAPEPPPYETKVSARPVRPAARKTVAGRAKP